MLLYPNAKINLGLRITERRTDGYHNLQTIFYPIDLSDILEVTMPYEHTGQCHLETTGLPLDTPPEGNILLSAYRAFTALKQIPSIALHLHKIIPTGAGLGGGSADAAYLLKALNHTLAQPLTDHELHTLAANLGADCPFFLLATPAIARGIGDQLTPINPGLGGYHILLVKPPVHISTREAYAGITPHRPDTDIRDIITRPIEQWPGLLLNDFEPIAFRQYPHMAQIKQTLYDHGALYASMTGSGSAIYGIFKTKPTPPQFPGCFTWQGLMQY